MRIKHDLKEFLNINLYSIAESHIECWKDRYFGYPKWRLEQDLEFNHDDSLEVENAEDNLQRKLTDSEKEYLIRQFHKEVVKQYVNYST